MPRAPRLSSRLDSLLDAVFRPVADARALFDEIAELLSPSELAQAQKKIRKSLREEHGVGADAAVITACVLHCTGFPAHRILRYLSLYVPDTLPPSLLRLAVDVIFRGQQPISESLLYDLTQYPYFESRLLARRGAEIAEKLAPDLGPEVLLFLYLQALRDDLSNEHVRLIALVLRSCAPSLVLRTRVGGVTADESDEVVRAVEAVETRALESEEDAPTEGRARRLESRAFDRHSASRFLDKYFSDDALAKMREAAPPPPPVKKPVQPRPSPEMPREVAVEIRPVSKPAPARTRTSPAEQNPPGTGAPPSRAASPSPHIRVRTGSRTAATTGKRRETAQRGRTRPAASLRVRMRSAKEKQAPAVPETAVPETAVRQAPVRQAPVREAPVRKAPARKRAVRPRRAHSAVRSESAASPRRGRGAFAAARFLWLAPPVLAAVAAAVFLLALRLPSLPASSPQPVPAAAAPRASPAAPTAAARQPPTVVYTVRPGDSLWKIFSSMRVDRSRWGTFLSNAQSLNGLEDPNRLHPGKVLTITTDR